ncbi:nicotinamide riboside transporter PnuC [Phytohabitans flavus]|uniref:Nicotinamide mononucleotide transporter n=1 Tax=Phytohabitans flavus TaxID=1076124 RepID=A0A6F8XQ93_9ACTN|nr:nicotinamide riboside transporter PnuC [Phytohabitans flavus]BCB75977.1 nicotinamide mononucleotide transporter [Phytohabitans flavus]
MMMFVFWGMSYLEVAGFAAGAASVWLYVRQSVWAWPVGIVNSGCWLVLFWTSRLYLDAGLQVVYIALGVAGWYWWLRGGDRPGRLPVRRTGRRHALVLWAVGGIATLVLWWAMTLAGDASPLLDAATTTVSLIAQYMLTRKLLGSWWCWIAVDVAYLGMYAHQELYLTAALQPLFVAMCVVGLRQWRASLRAGEADAVPSTGAERVAV